jgi:xanthine dehydrogenase accessory factor
MRDIATVLDAWLEQGKNIALATVTRTWGASPRPVGATLAVADDGNIAGSVSGGCIEGAVAQAALETLRTREARILDFTASSRSAWEAGLSCGGEVSVAVRPLNHCLYFLERTALQEDREYARLLSIDYRSDGLEEDGAASVGAAGAATVDATDAKPVCPVASTLLISADGSPLATQLPEDLTFESLRAFALIPPSQVCGILEVPHGHGCYRFSFTRIRKRPHLICVGAVHTAITLTQIARSLGYRTTIIDPRGIFSTRERFAHVDTLIHEWPQEAFKSVGIDTQTAVCVMTHDAKIDIPALEVALRSPAFYVGSLGRSTTQTLRYKQLRRRGFTRRELERIHGPIGLDLGGRDPAEVALAVMAEITAVRYGKGAASRKMAEFAPLEPTGRMAAVILAAGASKRMGFPKLLLTYEGETLIHRSARLACEGQFDPVIVVVGAYGDKIAEAISDLPVTVVRNPCWRDGQGSSVRAGIGALADAGHIDAAVLMVADQPFMRRKLLLELAAEYADLSPSARTGMAVVPDVQGRFGNPVLFDSSCFPLLSTLEGDRGARQILPRVTVVRMPVDDVHQFDDIDTQEDYHALCERGLPVSRL